MLICIPYLYLFGFFFQPSVMTFPFPSCRCIWVSWSLYSLSPGCFICPSSNVSWTASPTSCVYHPGTWCWISTALLTSPTGLGVRVIHCFLVCSFVCLLVYVNPIILYLFLLFLFKSVLKRFHAYGDFWDLSTNFDPFPHRWYWNCNIVLCLMRFAREILAIRKEKYYRAPP